MELKIMKESRKYTNFYQICSAVSITHFCFILYYATPIVSVLLQIQVIAETPDALRWYLQLPLLHPIIGLPFSGRRKTRKRCY
jgi:hypothetical protein